MLNNFIFLLTISSLFLAPDYLRASKICDGLSSKFFKSSYIADDFKPSIYWEGQSDHTKFSIWSSSAANDVYFATKKEATPEKIRQLIDDIAESRFEQAILLDHIEDNASNTFGILRESGTMSHTGIGELADKEISSDPIIKLLISNNKDRIKDGTFFGNLTSNSYTLLNGKEVHMTSILVQGHQVVAMHNRPRAPFITFDDLCSRISILISKKDKLPNKELQKELSLSMFAFYNIMPFYRGSASIGNVLFAGLYLSIFKEKIPFNMSGLDRIAMVLSEDDFVNHISTLNK